MKFILFLKVLIFTVLVPGTVAGYLPYRILTAGGKEPNSSGLTFVLLALPVILIGAAVYLRCAWDFAIAGSGTPAPIDSPKRLVVIGLYRYTRNPMYLGVLLVMLGESLCFLSLAVLEYAGFVFLFFHLFVIVYEEPVLQTKFGVEYEEYCRTVPRWLILSRLSKSTNGAT